MIITISDFDRIKNDLIHKTKQSQGQDTWPVLELKYLHFPCGLLLRLSVL